MRFRKIRSEPAAPLFVLRESLRAKRNRTHHSLLNGKRLRTEDRDHDLQLAPLISTEVMLPKTCPERKLSRRHIALALPSYLRQRLSFNVEVGADCYSEEIQSVFRSDVCEAHRLSLMGGFYRQVPAKSRIKRNERKPCAIGVSATSECRSTPIFSRNARFRWNRCTRQASLIPAPEINSCGNKSATSQPVIGNGSSRARFMPPDGPNMAISATNPWQRRYGITSAAQRQPNRSKSGQPPFRLPRESRHWAIFSRPERSRSDSARIMTSLSRHHHRHRRHQGLSGCSGHPRACDRPHSARAAPCGFRARWPRLPARQ